MFDGKKKIDVLPSKGKKKLDVLEQEKKKIDIFSMGKKK